MRTKSTPEYLSDLVSTLRWIDELYVEHYTRYMLSGEAPSNATYAARKEIASLRSMLRGEAPTKPALEAVRLLLASGVLRWHVPNQRKLLDNPQLLLHSFVCAALWPLVIGPHFSKEWFHALQEITSPTIANLVNDLRQEKNKVTSSVLALRFAQKLQNTRFADGILSLLADLHDPSRGGAALVAVATIRDNAAPPFMSNSKSLFKWLLTGAAGGIVGNRADDIVVRAWDWLSANVNIRISIEPGSGLRSNNTSYSPKAHVGVPPTSQEPPPGSLGQVPHGINNGGFGDIDLHQNAVKSQIDLDLIHDLPKTKVPHGMNLEDYASGVLSAIARIFSSIIAYIRSLFRNIIQIDVLDDFIKSCFGNLFSLLFFFFTLVIIIKSTRRLRRIV